MWPNYPCFCMKVLWLPWKYTVLQIIAPSLFLYEMKCPILEGGIESVFFFMWTAYHLKSIAFEFASFKASFCNKMVRLQIFRPAAGSSMAKCDKVNQVLMNFRICYGFQIFSTVISFDMNTLVLYRTYWNIGLIYYTLPWRSRQFTACFCGNAVISFMYIV